MLFVFSISAHSSISFIYSSSSEELGELPPMHVFKWNTTNWVDLNLFLYQRNTHAYQNQCNQLSCAVNSQHVFLLLLCCRGSFTLSKTCLDCIWIISQDHHAVCAGSGCATLETRVASCNILAGVVAETTLRSVSLIQAEDCTETLRELCILIAETKNRCSLCCSLLQHSLLMLCLPSLAPH